MNTKSEQLADVLNSLSVKELEGVLDALVLVTEYQEGQKLQSPTDGLGGIYLKPPYGELIASGDMKCFAKPRTDDRLTGRKVLVSGHKAYGEMHVGEPIEVGVGEFDDLFGDEHCVSKKERLQWWPLEEALYLYPVDEFKAYREPMDVHVKPGVQTCMEFVDFKGGKGSGNFGHEGRPGKVGGSSAGDAGGGPTTFREMMNARSGKADRATTIRVLEDKRDLNRWAIVGDTDGFNARIESKVGGYSFGLHHGRYIIKKESGEWGMTGGWADSASEAYDAAMRMVKDFEKRYPDGPPEDIIYMAGKELQGQPLSVTIAKTDSQATKGFSGRDSISDGEGLLIPLKKPTTGIWMKDTRMPLTVAFLDEGYKVLSLVDLKPMDETVHVGPEGSAWALEASPDWFAKSGMDIGDRIILP